MRLLATHNDTLQEVFQKKQAIKIKKLKRMEELKEIENDLGIGLLKIKGNDDELFTPPKSMQHSTNLTSD